MTISSWLSFGHPAAPGKGSAAGRKFLAPLYYSQRAVFASPPCAFFIVSCYVVVNHDSGFHSASVTYEQDVFLLLYVYSQSETNGTLCTRSSELFSDLIQTSREFRITPERRLGNQNDDLSCSWWKVGWYVQPFQPNTRCDGQTDGETDRIPISIPRGSNADAR